MNRASEICSRFEARSEAEEKQFGLMLLKVFNGIQIFGGELETVFEGNGYFLKETGEWICRLSLQNVFLMTSLMDFQVRGG